MVPVRVSFPLKLFQGVVYEAVFGGPTLPPSPPKLLQLFMMIGVAPKDAVSTSNTEGGSVPGFSQIHMIISFLFLISKDLRRFY